jgi:hypothetical protein
LEAREDEEAAQDEGRALQRDEQDEAEKRRLQDPVVAHAAGVQRPSSEA